MMFAIKFIDIYLSIAWLQVYEWLKASFLHLQQYVLISLITVQ